MIPLFALALASPPEVQPAELPPPPAPRVLSDGTLWLEHDGPRVAVEALWALPPEGGDQRLALQLAAQALGADRARIERVERLGASWSVVGGVEGLTLRVQAPPETVEQALVELVEGLQHLRGAREVRRSARSWARWRGEVGLSLERIHRRGVNHAWYPPGHPSRHAASEDELAGLRARHVRGAVDTVLASGQRRLAVVGRVDAARVARLSAIAPAGGDLVAERRGPGPRVGVTHVDRPGFDSALLSVCVAVPEPKDADAARVLVGALAGDFNSRAVQDLRETRGWIYTTRLQVVEGRICVETESASEQALDVLIALDGYLDGTRLTPGELTRARAGFAVELAGQSASAAERAAWLVRAQGHEADARAWAAEIDVDALDALGQVLLAPDRRVWVVTGDAAVIGPELIASGRTVRTVAAEELAVRP